MAVMSAEIFHLNNPRIGKCKPFLAPPNGGLRPLFRVVGFWWHDAAVGSIRFSRIPGAYPDTITARVQAIRWSMAEVTPVAFFLRTSLVPGLICRTGVA
jgi:hypothetical protein